MLNHSTDLELFTIGHSSLGFDEFIALLRQHGISAVADVRSTPYSRRWPHFNRESLRSSLDACQIRYLFHGDELGARRTEPECYDNGVFQYERIARTVAFTNGMERLRDAAETDRVALLCAEKDPLTCHRMILVCRHLRDDVTIMHIVGPGECESQDQAETRMLQLFRLPDVDLFRTRRELIEEAYTRQGEKIAWRNIGYSREEEL